MDVPEVPAPERRQRQSPPAPPISHPPALRHGPFVSGFLAGLGFLLALGLLGVVALLYVAAVTPSGPSRVQFLLPSSSPTTTATPTAHS